MIDIFRRCRGESQLCLKNPKSKKSLLLRQLKKSALGVALLRKEWLQLVPSALLSYVQREKLPGYVPAAVKHCQAQIRIEISSC